MVKYTLNPDRYDLDEIYAYTDSNDERLQTLNDPHIIRYRTKTIKSGNVLECEVYPIWSTHTSTSRARKTRESREAQKRLNQKNTVKNLVRLVNTNFTDSDIHATFTYNNPPSTVEEAIKTMSRYMRKLRDYCKRHGLLPLKYVFTTEYGKKSKRIHHHVIMNFPDRDLAEQMWTHGTRSQTRRLVADEDGYEGIARYIAKNPQGAKCYCASKNLAKPQITIADCKFTRRKVNRLVSGDVQARGTFEKIYDGYTMTRFTPKTSDFVSGAYIYVKMTRTRPKGGKKSEIRRE